MIRRLTSHYRQLADISPSPTSQTYIICECHFNRLVKPPFSDVCGAAGGGVRLLPVLACVFYIQPSFYCFCLILRRSSLFWLICCGFRSKSLQSCILINIYCAKLNEQKQTPKQKNDELQLNGEVPPLPPLPPRDPECYSYFSKLYTT